MRIARGRIIFSNKHGGQEIPVQNMKIQLWDLDIVKNDFLADGHTKADGSFELEYDPASAGERRGDKPDLVLRLLDREYSYDKDGVATSQFSVVASFDGEADVTASVYDFGTLEAAYWEYENPEDSTKVAFTPRVAVVEGRVPQPQRTGHSIAQAAAALKNSLRFVKFNLINKFNPDRPTVKELEHYPANLTRKMGADKSRSDEYLAELVLNGFNPCIPTKTGDGKFVVAFRWDGVTQDGRHFAPNTTATFRLENDALVLESMAIQKRMAGAPDAHAISRSAQTYTPDSPVWDGVKRLFRVNYFAFGEVNSHLTGTHLNIEQYIVAIRRHVHRSPVARLLLPHFFGTVAVNLGANTLLITKDGLVGKGSALTPESVAFVSRAYLGTLNWVNWKPRKPICKGHRFAKLSQLYWDVLTQYVDEYFVKNSAEIDANWAEILSMSNELVRHAVPYVAESNNFYDMGEINGQNNPHPIVDGVAVALSPVCESGQADAAGTENLKQLCRYLLFHATFKHSWVNDSQFDIGGEVMFASLGVDDDLTSEQVDPNRVVPADEALLQPFITYLLAYTRYGYIVRNEDDDMNPALIKILKNNTDKFRELGMDIRDIRSCINT